MTESDGHHVMSPSAPPRRRPTADANALELVDVQHEILAELRWIRELLERDTSSGRHDEDDRRAQLLQALADTMEGFDLEFTAGEVLDRRESDHELDEALRACRISDTAGLGALFRELRDRELDGITLVRDGRYATQYRNSVTVRQATFQRRSNA